MKKLFIVLGIILLSGTQFSCSNDEDQDISSYVEDVKPLNTGGEDGEILPPPPPPEPQPQP